MALPAIVHGGAQKKYRNWKTYMEKLGGDMGI
jgi:hypothetical protein